MARWSSLVLTGGRARRLPDKLEQSRDGLRIVDHAIAGITEGPVIAVGHVAPADPQVEWVPQAPDFAGPVSGLRAGIGRITTDLVFVLAGDMPAGGGLAEQLMAELVDHEVDAAVPVDCSGHRQPLCAAYRSSALAAVLNDLPDRGAAMREVLARLSVLEVTLSADGRARLFDIDTQADLQRWLGADD